MQKSGETTGAAPGDDQCLGFGDVRILEQMVQRAVQVERASEVHVRLADWHGSGNVAGEGGAVTVPHEDEGDGG